MKVHSFKFSTFSDTYFDFRGLTSYTIGEKEENILTITNGYRKWLTVSPSPRYA